MPLTIIPMAINLLTAVMLWRGELILAAKIVVTLLIVLKFALFFYSYSIAEPRIAKNIGTVICAVINLGLMIYCLTNGAWTVFIGLALTLILLIIWILPAVFSFGKKDGNEQ